MQVGRTVRKKRHARLRELERLAAETIAFTAPLPADSDAELAHAPDPGYGAPDLPLGLRRSEAKPAAALHDDLSDAAPRKKRQKAQAAVPSPVPEELTAPDQESQRPRAAAVQKSARKRKNKFKQEPGGGASPAQVRPKCDSSRLSGFGPQCLWLRCTLARRSVAGAHCVAVRRLRTIGTVSNAACTHADGSSRATCT